MSSATSLPRESSEPGICLSTSGTRLIAQDRCIGPRIHDHSKNIEDGAAERRAGGIAQFGDISQSPFLGRLKTGPDCG